jgi:molybdenum cofactor cytidylyltransferase
MGRAGDIDVLLLAAGLSTRMGETNKLLLEFSGQPLIRHTAATITRAGLGTILVVTGFEAEAVATALEGLPVKTSFNAVFEQGQMTSVTHGLRTIIAANHENRTGWPTGVMICLADMPYLDKTDYQDLAAAFFENGGDRIALPEYAGKRGNPIILPARLINEASSGELNTGCRHMIENRPDEVDRIAVENSAFVRDIDTPPDYDRALRAAYPGAPCCG